MRKDISREYLQSEYVDKGRSTYEIATKFNTYANRIRRLLKKYGIALRDKSEAQSVAIQTGRHKHPTRGRKRPAEVRIKIGEGVSKAWKDMSDSDKAQRVLYGKRQWESMSEDQREEFRKLAVDAVRRAAEEGSKLEKFLLIELRRRDYNVAFHKSHIVSNEQLQVDLFLPDLSTVIEIDGPSHFLPIWGEKNLTKHLASDYAKNGLLLTSGYVVIRIKYILKSTSQVQFRHLLDKILLLLESIRIKFPDREHRFIEMEIS
jgi:very-short-patch-repair endonuclease